MRATDSIMVSTKLKMTDKIINNSPKSEYTKEYSQGTKSPVYSHINTHIHVIHICVCKSHCILLSCVAHIVHSEKKVLIIIGKKRKG